MSETPLRIASLEDLARGLRDPDQGTRWGLLRAIARNPAKAAGYGPVDQLLLPLWREAEGLERLMCLGALLPFPYAELFLEEFFATEHQETLLLLAQRLTQEPAEWLVPRLASRFLADPLPRRQLLVANMLSAQRHLPVEVRVRCAVLAAADGPLPEWSPAWVRELPAAEPFLERLGKPAYEGLLAEEVPEGSRRWLAEWGLRLGDVRALRRLPPRTTLELLRGRPEWWSEFPIAEWAGQPELRSLAFACGAPLPAVLEPDLALIARWESVDDLAALLDHADWQVRSAAVNRLVELGSDTPSEPRSDAGQLALLGLRERLYQRP